MLSHANLVSNVLAAAAVFPQIQPEWTALSFLPLCHSFERTAGHNFMIHSGVTIAYAESVERVPDNILEVRPHIMCSVPRLYEKMYARVNEKVARDSALRQALFRWALAAGRQGFAARLARRAPGLLLRLKLALADRLVFSKIQARTGGRLQLFISGGAPLAREIAEFFGAAGMLICEGYGLTETSPVITCNRPDRMKPGTVGLPLDGVEVRIAEDGEILSRGPHIMLGYFGRPEATREAIDADGYFHTGDLGHVDPEGFLVITDRKKDIIVTSGGKNIAPQPIENKLKTNRFFAEVVMIGDRRKFAVALVVPNYEVLAGVGRRARHHRNPRGARAAPGGRGPLPGPRVLDDGRARAVREDQEAGAAAEGALAGGGRAHAHAQGEAARRGRALPLADRRACTREPRSPVSDRVTRVLYLATLGLIPWAALVPFPWLHENARWSDVLFALAFLAWLAGPRSRAPPAAPAAGPRRPRPVSGAGRRCPSSPLRRAPRAAPPSSSASACCSRCSWSPPTWPGGPGCRPGSAARSPRPRC